MHNASRIFQLVRARTAPASRPLLALGSALVFACVLLAPGVQAQEAQRADRQQQREMALRDTQRQEMQRQEMLREQRAFEEQQRRLQAQEQQQDGQRRHNRMTADERSELRRQINEANQDIYARPRERR